MKAKKHIRPIHRRWNLLFAHYWRPIIVCVKAATLCQWCEPNVTLPPELCDANAPHFHSLLFLFLSHRGREHCLLPWQLLSAWVCPPSSPPPIHPTSLLWKGWHYTEFRSLFNTGTWYTAPGIIVAHSWLYCTLLHVLLVHIDWAREQCVLYPLRGMVIEKNDCATHCPHVHSQTVPLIAKLSLLK